MTEDKMVGGHHRLSGHEFEACCGPWGRKESDNAATEQQQLSPD